ncbi:methylenetetrahydrofolate dehydrogenase (NADP+)/methenyltetrahydrofolate cyclohydrolase [Symbiobacterium terraclitae]|uniref:Bifunctional protein FolD n=1 Tax=Symbiobacterium terraclitae TaxID=557451 RepID=A0ABS4JUP7_9FIRM|nr:bifunctional 5,10-methylenetetrahydrofolate dehydrogenase/5,10-methenyltetrahydrofolate cyclohydrolase [Symbiobacterium terraclitae]MBP2018660.1 methylenetetrahydrofolate dehydrogenase (NADP+)/methenyltetrahydrofolate cyclohydrolase [Symbiobacterium terraclitae]
MRLLEGKSPAESLKADVMSRARALAAAGHPPRLAAVLAGRNEASDLYIARKERLGRSLGIAVEAHRLPDAKEDELVSLVRQLSLRPDVDGIMVEQPLPDPAWRDAVVRAIDPFKDVDGATGFTGGLLGGQPAGLVPATPLAVMHLLQYYRIPLRGAHVTIVGHSPVVGRPLALLMLREDATVTVCHKATRDLAQFTRQADILVSAAGVPGLITGDMVRPGAVVVDVGINLVSGRTVGDVDFESVAPVASAVTPVPGGVGPLTTVMLLANTVLAAERRCPALTQSAAD